MITEAFIHYLWQFNRLSAHLYSTSGEEIHVLSRGIHNLDEGPDFLEAQMIIGDTLWAGSVEIHLKTSDWRNHRHDENEKYHSVILHVVFQHDEESSRNLPTVEIRDQFDPGLLEVYEGFLQSNWWIPCANQIVLADTIQVQNMIEKSAIERLEAKNDSMQQVLTENKGDWGESYYILLAASMGMKVNKTGFEMLAKSLSVKIVEVYASSLFQLEALVFGQSGLLEQEAESQYVKDLFEEYSYLKSKHHLHPIPARVWNFFRIHPGSFPGLRLSQWAHLLHKGSHRVSAAMEAKSVDDLRKLFSCRASSFWDTHYVFGRISPPKIKEAGKALAHHLILNHIIPFGFFYAHHTAHEEIKEKMFSFYQELPPEQNSMIREWAKVGVIARNAFDSQALIQLKSCYCQHKLCLNCGIGIHLLHKLNT